MAPLLRFRTAERGFARSVVERRSPQAGSYSDRLVESEVVSSASSPVQLERRDDNDSTSGVPTVDMPSLSASTKVLAALIVILSIVVLAVAGFRLRKLLRSRRPKTSRSPHLKSLSLCQSPVPEKIVSEKRNPMYTQTLIDFGYDGLQPPSKALTTYSKADEESIYSKSEDQYVGWVPQIRSWHGEKKDTSSPDVVPRPFFPPTPPAPAAVKPSRFSRLAAVLTRSPKPSVASFNIGDAPPYTSAASTPRSSTTVHVPTPSAPALRPATSSDPKFPSAPKQKRKRPPPSIRVEAPHSKVPRASVPDADATLQSVPTITVDEVPQTAIVDSEQGTRVETIAMKSPTRLDSAGLNDSTVCDANGSALRLPKSSAGHSHERSSTSGLSASNASSSTAGPEVKDEVHASGKKKLPRLVIVVKTFSPNMPDELRVQPGDVLRLINEFRDGWCAVERLGTGGEQGVVPRFCIADRPSIVPDRPKAHSIVNGTCITFTGSSAPGSNSTMLTPQSSNHL